MRAIPSLADLKNTDTIECHEPMVSLNTLEPLISCYADNQDMFPYTGREIFTRSALREKIKLIQEHLNTIDQGLKLLVYYGYRHPAVQTQYYQEMQNQLRHPSDDETMLEERTNLFIAHPSIAGHPTGGAIDVTILYQGKELDMGCKIYGFNEPDKIPTYSNQISEEHHRNRKLLHDSLLGQGFAPFYGEWWHFSYGDKEWALFYQKPNAIYDQLDLRTSAFVPSPPTSNTFLNLTKIGN